MERLILCMLALSLQGCLLFPVLGVGAAAVKYKWHRDEVEKIKEYRESVLSEFKEINRKLEKLTK